MIAGAVYICPVRGLAGLEPPEPTRLLQSAKAARDLGLERLVLPILEESLSGNTKFRLKFLDGLILALDRVAEAGLTALLIAPATKLLGLDWVPSYLVKGYRDPKAVAIFVGGALRHLYPMDWWADPPLIQRRIGLFRELVSAVAGHPALTDWALLDRAFEFMRPEQEAAEFVLMSFIAEIRERDETAKVHLGLAWSDLVEPQPALGIASRADGIRMSGGENRFPGLPPASRVADEVRLSAYLSALSLWLYEKPLDAQIGFGFSNGAGDPEEVAERLPLFAGYGVSSLTWMTLVDPEPGLRQGIPWVLRPGLENAGLLDPSLEPKKHAEEWIRAAKEAKPGGLSLDFIDVSREEYLNDPAMHIPRLWDHFRESIAGR